MNCLAPGWFRTEQNKALYENKAWVAYLEDRIPLDCPGQPHDLDGAVGHPLYVERGMPISALTGSRRVMEHLRPLGDSEMSGTYLAHLTAVEAARADHSDSVRMVRFRSMRR
ncbi:MAG: hypothetical protein ACOCYC_01500 [bacterium]